MSADPITSDPENGGGPVDHHRPEGREISRRDLLKTGAAAGAATIGLSATTGSASATTSPFLLAPTGPSVLLGAVSGLLTDNTSNGEALWDQIRATALEMEYTQNSTLGSLRNDAEMLAEYLRLDVAVAIVESAEDDPGKSQTTDDAIAVLDEEISNIKRNLLNFWTVQYMATIRRINWIISDDTGEITVDNIVQIQVLKDDGAVGTPGITEAMFTDEDLYTGALDEYIGLDDQLDDPEKSADDRSGLGSLSIDYNITHLGNNSSSIPLPYGHSVPLEDGTDYPIPLIAKGFAEAESTRTAAAAIAPLDAESDEFNHWNDDTLLFGLSGHIKDYYESRNEGWPSSGFSGDDLSQASEFAGPQLMVPERQEGDESIGDAGPATILDAEAFLDVYDRLDDVYQQESSNISTMVDNLYDAAANGEISAEEIASGSALKEAAQEGDDWQAAAGYYRGLGLAEADAPARIEIEDGTIEAEGMLFRTVSDDSTEPLPLDEAINFDEQEQTGTDENGDPIMADVWPGGLHAALRITAVNSDDPLLDQTGVSEGDVGTFDLSSRNVTIVESDEDPLTFEDRGLFEPDDSTEGIMQTLTQAYDKEQESRNGDTSINVDLKNPFTEWNPLGGGGDWIGLAIIGGILLMVFGWVTDLLPFVGGD